MQSFDVSVLCTRDASGGETYSVQPTPPQNLAYCETGPAQLTCGKFAFCYGTSGSKDIVGLPKYLCLNTITALH